MDGWMRYMHTYIHACIHAHTDTHTSSHSLPSLARIAGQTASSAPIATAACGDDAIAAKAVRSAALRAAASSLQLRALHGTPHQRYSAWRLWTHGVVGEACAQPESPRVKDHLVAHCRERLRPSTPAVPLQYPCSTPTVPLQHPYSTCEEVPCLITVGLFRRLES